MPGGGVPNPCLFGFLAFVLFKEFLAILSVFPFFYKDFRGLARKIESSLFGGFLAVQLPFWISLPLSFSRNSLRF